MKKTPLHSFTNCSDRLQDKTDNRARESANGIFNIQKHHV